ncbi:hypothetical protein [uncultured Marinococcus sp.]|uniref:hypothetical protein n=1 Tax=uncultured Marinococcus sp. TaxID=487012 RepID=UPI0026291F53|nr:hypothetical protein [uncultured Marinococcus sp.]
MRIKVWMICIVLLSLACLVLGIIVLVTIPGRKAPTSLLVAQGVVLLLVGTKFLVSLKRTSKQNHQKNDSRPR